MIFRAAQSRVFAIELPASWRGCSGGPSDVFGRVPCGSRVPAIIVVTARDFLERLSHNSGETPGRCLRDIIDPESTLELAFLREYTSNRVG